MPASDYPHRTLLVAPIRNSHHTGLAGREILGESVQPPCCARGVCVCCPWPRATVGRLGPACLQTKHGGRSTRRAALGGGLVINSRVAFGATFHPPPKSAARALYVWGRYSASLARRAQPAHRIRRTPSTTIVRPPAVCRTHLADICKARSAEPTEAERLASALGRVLAAAVDFVIVCDFRRSAPPPELAQALRFGCEWGQIWVCTNANVQHGRRLDNECS